MKKLSFWEFTKHFKYYAFRRDRQKINGTLFTGYTYKTEHPITPEQRKILLNYSNVVVGCGCYQYAPELKFTTIFIANSKSKLKNA